MSRFIIHLTTLTPIIGALKVTHWVEKNSPIVFHSDHVYTVAQLRGHLQNLRNQSQEPPVFRFTILPQDLRFMINSNPELAGLLQELIRIHGNTSTRIQAHNAAHGSPS